MRKPFILFLAALLPLLALSCQPGKVDPLPVMSFNVRYGTAKDGDHVWENRKDAACAMILDQRPAVFGVQEALDFQLTYFQDGRNAHRIAVDYKKGEQAVTPQTQLHLHLVRNGGWCGVVK